MRVKGGSESGSEGVRVEVEVGVSVTAVLVEVGKRRRKWECRVLWNREGGVIARAGSQ